MRPRGTAGQGCRPVRQRGAQAEPAPGSTASLYSGGPGRILTTLYVGRTPGAGFMAVTLLLSAPGLDPDRLHGLALSLGRTINAETDMTAGVPEEDPRPGAKGDPVTIGAIVLALITSGAAAKLCEVLGAYFERDSKLEVALERDDGSRLDIKAENLSSARMEETVGLVREFLAGGA